MDIQAVDVILRVSGATTLLFLAALLARDARSSLPALLFVPLALGLAAFVSGNSPDTDVQLDGAADGIAHFLTGYVAVFLWWFSLSCFDRGFRVRGPILAAGLLWIIVATLDRGIIETPLAHRGLSWLLVALGFGMVAHLCWRLLSDRAGDLLQRRREARVIVAVALGGLLLLDLSIDLLLGFQWRPRGFAMGQNAAILAVALWLASRLLTADARILGFAGAPHGRERDLAADEDPRLRKRVAALIEEEKVHLDPTLTFADFVRGTGFPERSVRRFINQELGHDHFRAFLNVHRVAEARRRLAEACGAKLIAIAFDSGFASLASFNRAFRAECGCAPSVYRERVAEAALHESVENPAFEERAAAF